MKQSKISRQNILSTFFTEEEIEVAETLLDLGNSVLVSESRNNFSWGCRRKRSTLFAAQSSAPAPSSPSPSIHGTEIEIEPQVKVQPSTSPTTPLSFSPSESEEKSKHSSKKSKKRTREKYMEIIEGLTQRRDLLKGEVENVRNYYNKLKAHNLELKSMKQKALTTCLKEEGMNKFWNLEMNLAQQYQITAVAHHQQFILDQMTMGSSSQISDKIHYPFIPMAPSSNGLGNINHVGPVRVPDLNISAEETFGVDPSQPLDINRDPAAKRARFAEARRLRKGIIKTKMMRSGLGGVKPLRSR
ncbi:Uncharacterized protein Adt_24891 [Abeliophyllum distichum]|uniref:Uncharacterized protein n=1 Tax=Abeliophyllum distichum TaxID=126358 RepID=A0ABD1SF26_9LAMI